MKEEEKIELLKDFAKWYRVNNDSDSIVHSTDYCIENYINSLKPELEVGKWYKAKSDSIALYKGCNIETYGINCIGDWISDAYWFHDWILKDGEWTPATDKEVEEALIAEANRRAGTRVIKCLHGYDSAKLSEIEGWYWDGKCLRYMIVSGTGCIFENGKWAEIIEEPLELTLEEIAEKFGVNVEQIKIKK